MGKKTKAPLELGLIFFRLGCVGFGGPLAVLSLFEEEFCQKRKWMAPEEFAESLAFCKILPGPVTTQLSILIGSRRYGKLGGLIAGVCYILPAFFIVLLLGYFYEKFRESFFSEDLFSGLQAGALAVVLYSALLLAKPFKDRFEAWGIGVLSGLIVYFFPTFEPFVIFFFGVLGAWFGQKERVVLRSFHFPSWLYVSFLGPAPAALEPLMASVFFKLFWMSFKAGAFVFGTGLAIVPLIEADAVQKYHWLTHSEFMDGLALGQVTPGPVVITATFVGYKVAGFLGALVATFGIFIPSFFNILFLMPRIWERWSGTPAALGFSRGAIPAVIGALIGVTVRLGLTVLTTYSNLALFLFCLVLAFIYRLPIWLIIFSSGIIGALVRLGP